MKYNQAPLPLQGQKRRFLKEFTKALATFPSDAVYVDLFGGSGLLSHTVKQHYPDARVVYNDFDGFRNRLEAIPKTNALLAQLRLITADFPKKKRITEPVRSRILEVLEQADKDGYADWISLSANLLFSGKYAVSIDGFRKETMYNNIRLSGYGADGYLQGVEVVSEDYRALHQRFKGVDNVVFIIDPPYLSTDSKAYKNDNYWKLTDYLDVLNTLDGNYFYFTSNKSQIVDLCGWIEQRTGSDGNPFSGATCSVASGVVNYNSNYQDMMYYFNGGLKGN